MKRIWIVLATAFVIGFTCCSTGEKKETVESIPKNMELSIEPGEHWQGKMKVFIFSINNTPQLAAWIEDTEGKYISTITVTNRSAKKTWRSAPKEGRPEALPVWNHRILNSSAQTDIDTVSSATPKGAVDTSINNDALINGHEYNVYLEINHSFDFNDTWTENNSGVNGQPSVIYHAKFTAGQPGTIDLTPIGYGSVDGSDGNITEGLVGLTTALDMIKRASMIIR